MRAARTLPSVPGRAASTTASNGTAAWANASRSVTLTPASRLSNDVAGSTAVRSTRVLTNMPTNGSSTA